MSIFPSCSSEGAKFGAEQFYLTESVYKVVLQKSIPAQIRQRILYISIDEV